MAKRGLAIIALVLALAGPAPASGHDVTPDYNDAWPAGGVLEYRWESASEPPGWMRSAITSTAGQANSSNSSRAPTFRYDAGGSGIIYYATTMQNPCDDDSVACSRYFTSSGTWRVYFTKQNESLGGGATMKWCDHSQGPTCRNVARAAIHEFGHVLSLNHTSGHDEGDSVMWATIPEADQTGGGTGSFKPCDRAALQMVYDLASFSDSYSSCLDHVGSGSDNLQTRLSFFTSHTVRCAGQFVSFGGTLSVEDLSAYGRLGGNGVAARTVYIKRAAPGSDNFTDHATDTTGSSGDWSRSITFASNVSFDWRIRFAGEAGLGARNSETIRVSWRTPCIERATVVPQ